MNWIMYTIQWSYTFLAFINFAFHTFMQSPNKITTGLLVEKLNTVNRNKIGAIFIQLQMVQMMACSPNHVVTKCCNSRVWDEINLGHNELSVNIALTMLTTHQLWRHWHPNEFFQIHYTSLLVLSQMVINDFSDVIYSFVCFLFVTIGSGNGLVTTIYQNSTWNRNMPEKQT